MCFGLVLDIGFFCCVTVAGLDSIVSLELAVLGRHHATTYGYVRPLPQYTLWVWIYLSGVPLLKKLDTNILSTVLV